MSAVTVPPASAWDRVKGYTPPARYLPIIATFALFHECIASLPRVAAPDLTR